MISEYNRIDGEIEELFADVACQEGIVGVAKLFSHLSLCLDRNLRYQLDEDTNGDEK